MVNIESVATLPPGEGDEEGIVAVVRLTIDPTNATLAEDIFVQVSAMPIGATAIGETNLVYPHFPVCITLLHPLQHTHTHTHARMHTHTYIHTHTHTQIHTIVS